MSERTPGGPNSLIKPGGVRPLGGAAPAAPAPPAGQPATAASSPSKAPAKALPTTPERQWGEMVLGFAMQIERAMGVDGHMERTPELEESAQQQFSALYRRSNLNLPPQQAKALYDGVLWELFGFGPIEPYLQDDTITEVMINNADLLYIERAGKIEEIHSAFVNEDHVMRIINRILRPLGRHLDRKWPLVDARLPDGSRVNVIVPPCCIRGNCVTIRKFSKKRLKVEDLINFGSITPQVAEFLKACVLARLNIIVSGGTGSGKTTLLNVLSNYIPPNERIVTVEDSAELQLNQRHVVTLEARPADPDGTGRVAIRDLVINCLRMRPDRIVVGECRGGESLDMLQAMNTGHDGSLTTLHANTPRDALARLETMVMMAGMELPVRVIREQVASAVDLIVQQARMRDGSRKIVSVTEVQGMEGEVIVLQDIFKYEEEGLDENGSLQGRFVATGIRPRFMPRLENAGIHLGGEIFAKPTTPPGRR